MASILVVDDEVNLVDAIRYVLIKEGFQVETASNGLEAVEVARRIRPELVLLDLMLPDLSGFEVCRRIRRDSSVPIIMLTARDDEVDKVAGLEMGADDYVTKPFSMRELVARIRAHIRRSEVIAAPEEDAGSEAIVAGGLQISAASHEALLNGKILALQPREFDLLAFLARQPGLVFSRDQIIERVWGPNAFVDTRTVDVHVRGLRKKIETDPSSPKYIETVRGVGYRFRKEG
ncbi:MAG: two-component system, OmpR family, response regulator [Chloroflexi bacterium]|jgi:DNA-binding response OmpR family regulator|nr:MAG: two-component system, OmpR family, response regulator [Chloroflexota bacterium]